MPQFPFRQPVNPEDSPDDQANSQWKPPDYATVASDDKSSEWKPPEYATAVKSEKPKTQHEKDLEAAKKNVTFSKSVENAIERTKEFGGDTAIGRFLKEVPDAAGKLLSQVRETGKSAAEDIRQGNYPSAFHRVVQPFTEPMENLQEMAMNRALPATPQASSPTDFATKALEFGTGIPASDIWSKMTHGNVAGGLGEAAGSAALLWAMGKMAGHEPSQIRPDDSGPSGPSGPYTGYGPRRSGEIPYRMEDIPVRRTISDADRLAQMPKTQVPPIYTGKKGKIIVEGIETPDIANKSKADDEAQTKKASPNEIIRSPIPMVDQRVLDYLNKNQTVDYKSGQIENIPISKLEGTQPTLTASKVNEYVDKGDRPDITDVPTRAQDAADQPVVLKIGDKLVVQGGHHRIAADLARGKDTVQAITYNADVPTDLLKPKPEFKLDFPNPFRKAPDVAAQEPITESQPATAAEEPSIQAPRQVLQPQAEPEQAPDLAADLERRASFGEEAQPSTAADMSDAYKRMLDKVVAGETTGTPEAKADFAERQRVEAARKEWKAPSYAEPAREADEILPPEDKPGATASDNFWTRDTQRMKDEAYRRSQDPIQQAKDREEMDRWNKIQENIKASETPLRQPIEKVTEQPAKLSIDITKAALDKMEREHPEASKLSEKAYDALADKYIKAAKAEAQATPEKQEKQYTIENAPPNRRAKIMRGAHAPVDVLFTDSNSREFFGAGQDLFSKGVAKPGVLQRLQDAAGRIATRYGIDPKTATRYIKDYNQEIRDQSKAVDKEGGNITARSFDEFIKNKMGSDTVEMAGGLGGAKGGKTKRPPSQGPLGPTLDRLFQATLDAKERMGEQEQINKEERARRFAEFGAVKATGVKGARQALSKLRGEFEKVEPGAELGLKPKETDSLFTAIKQAKISNGEKARGYTALFKLMNGEGVPTRSDLAVLDRVFGNNFADRITEMHGGLGAIGLKVAKLANTAKSLENAISLAAPLRHGAGMLTRKEFYPAFVDMFKFFGSKDFYNATMDSIQNRPGAQLANDAGVFFSRPDSMLDSEEEFLNSYAGQLPGLGHLVSASSRAYSGFLNKLRADVFDSMILKADRLGHETSRMTEGKDGEQIQVPTKTAEKLANYVNVATGRGDLGRLNRITNELNVLLWSPRMIASRVQMLNPKFYMDMPQGMRLDATRSLLGVAAMGVAIDAMSYAAGAKVGTNILSTDFGKARFGQNLLDPWGGFQQYIVGIARFLAGKTDSSIPTNRLEVAGRFLANKESPVASLVHTLLTAKQFTGRQMDYNLNPFTSDPHAPGSFIDEYGRNTNIQSQVLERYLPIFTQDLYNLVSTDPKWSEDIGLTTALTVGSLAGMTQSYPEKKTGKLSLGKSRKLTAR